MATAGSIVIDLLMKTGAFSTDVKRAEKEIRQLGENIKKFATIAATATTAVAVGFAYMTKQAINSMDELDEMSQSLGLTVEQLSTLGKVAKVEGMNLQDFGGVMAKLIKTLGEARSGAEGAGDIFEAMGLDPKAFKDSEDALLQISEKFAGYEDGLEKTALAQEIFGKSGASFIAFLNQGADGIKKVGDELNIFGNVSAKAASDAATFNDNLTKIAVVGGSAMQRFAEGILPAMNNFIQSLIDSFKGSKDFREDLEKLVAIHAVEWAENFMIALSHVADVGVFVVRVMVALSNSIRAMIADIGLLYEGAGIFRPSNMDKLFTPGKSMFGAFKDQLKDRNEAAERFNNSLSNIMTKNAAYLTETMQKSVADARLARQFPGSEDNFGVLGADKPEAPNPAAIKAETERLAREKKEREAAAKASAKEMEKRAEQTAKQLDDAKNLSVEYDKEQKHSLEMLKKKYELIGLTENERRVQEEVNKVLESTQKKIEQIEEKKREAIRDGVSQVVIDEYDAQIAKIGELGDAYESLARSQAQSSIDAQRTFSFGWNQAFNQFVEDSTNQATKAGDMFNSLTSNMATAIDQFVETGKFSFGDFASSVIKDLIKIELKMRAMQLFRMAASAISGAITNVSGGGFGTGNDFGREDLGQYFAEGGYTGSGGKYEPAGIVHRGEYVLNSNATKRIGVAALDRMNGYAQGGYVGDTGPAMDGGGSVTVNVINQSSQPVQASQGQPRFDGTKFVQDIILTDLRRNGPIGQALRTA